MLVERMEDIVGRMARFGSIYSLVLLNIVFFVGSLNAIAGDTIRINGTGSGLEMMKPLIAAYSKASRNVSFEMEKPLGSSGAIKALLAGAIDIAVTSKPLDPGAMAKGARIRHFGKTPLVMVTDKTNPRKNISTKELEDIYSGITTRWENKETIKIILRPEGDIDTKILRGLSVDMNEAITKAQRRRGMIVAVTDPESNETVSKTAGSIGASGLTGALIGKAPLNVLALNGVIPGVKTLADGSYPMAKELHFAVTDKTSRAAAKFLDYVYSKKGRAIAKNIGVHVTTDDK